MRNYFLILFILPLLLLGPALSKPQEPKIQNLSIRDECVIGWLRSEYHYHSGKTMSYDEARFILLSVRQSCRKHVSLKMSGVLENVILSLIWTESRFNPQAIGKYDKLPAYRRSEGLTQIRRDIAAMILRRRIGRDELVTDLALNIDLGVRHLLSSGTLQAYNAGQRGALKGRGVNYSKSSQQILRKFPWMSFKKNASIKKPQVYDRFFKIKTRKKHAL